MAINSPALIASIRGAYPHQGSKTFPSLASAVGLAVTQWVRVPTFVLMRGTSAGLLGSGTVTGKVLLKASGLVAPALISVGIEASQAQEIGGAIEQGIASSFTGTAQYQGTSTSVGSGTDTSNVVLALAPPLVALLQAQLAGLGIQGPLAPLMARGLGSGISSLIQTARGVGGVVGVSSGLPGSGVSVSVLI